MNNPQQQQQQQQQQRSWFGGTKSPNSGEAISRKKRPRSNQPPPLSSRLNSMMTNTSNNRSSSSTTKPSTSTPLQHTTTNSPTASSSSSTPIHPYHVLQIRRDATNLEIRDAYRRLALWHHPGRAKGSCGGLEPDELARRFGIFEMVVACYETLVDREARHACDQLLKRMEVSRIAQHLPVAGELHVGGQRFWTGPAIQQQQPPTRPASVVVSPTTSSQSTRQTSFNHLRDTQQDKEGDGHGGDGIPSLSRVSSHSSTDELPDTDGVANGSESQCNPLFLSNLLPPCGGGGGNCQDSSIRRSNHDYEDDYEDDDDAPSISTSSTTTLDVIHYSESETNRLFGGSMALLHQARKWKPFTDPYVVFEQVFGAHMFPVQRYPRTLFTSSSSPILMTPASSTKNGSSRTLKDGTRLLISSRMIQDRQLTRIEKVITTPQGQRQVVVSVSSDDCSGTLSPTSTSATTTSQYSFTTNDPVDPQRPLMVAVSSSDEEQTNLFCLTQDWLNMCPFGSG